ncbi:hypothetical protein Pgy4_41639, partial [Pseudomonas savastanoi pv. glycinea str. race 4]
VTKKMNPHIYMVKIFYFRVLLRKRQVILYARVSM